MNARYQDCREQEYDLSVVTVCRNAGEMLRETLDSVLWQKTHSDLRIQHILIDGVSTDGCAEIGASAAAGGEVEYFLSEPDTGIYDAMNKGLRQVQGKVVFFLNCGDRFCEVDLHRFIDPILDGTYVSVAADDYMVLPTRIAQIDPIYEKRYLDTIVCHQGYFAASRLFDEFGDFDTSLTCIADAYFINLVIQKYGKPLIINEPVAYFLYGGFSCDAQTKFVPEFVELRRRFWPEIEQLCSTDRDYYGYAVAIVAKTAAAVWKWMQLHGSSAPDYITELQRQCRALRRFRPGVSRHLALWWFEKVYLTALLRTAEPAKIHMKMLRYMLSLAMPVTENIYIRKRLISKSDFWELVRSRFMYIFAK